MTAARAEVQSSLQPAGPVAAATAEMTWMLSIGAGVVFAIVMLALGWALWRRRARQQEPAAELSTSLSNNPSSKRATWWWIGGAGIAFPLLVLLPLLVYATLRTHALAPPTAPSRDELLVTVEGRLWWWKVSYRTADGGVAVVSANQINLPTGRPVTLALVSGDVIHSFWVPALAGKVDMVPGKVHHLRLQADQPGVYRGQCAEFCGEQHARMALHVVAQPPADFERWLQAQAQPAQVPRDAQAVRGLHVFAERRCNACHTVGGLGPVADIGPDLTHVASRLHLGAGTVPFGRQALAQWVAHPQQLKPGVRMPGYEMDAASMQALVSFLEQLR